MKGERKKMGNCLLSVCIEAINCCQRKENKYEFETLTRFKKIVLG